MLLKLVPQETKVNFLGMRKVAAVLSIILVIGSLALFFVNSLNYGIDFKGGITVEVGYENKAVPLAEVRELMGTLNLGDVSVKQFGSDRDLLIRIERQPGGDAEQSVAMTNVRDRLSNVFPELIYRQGNIIGPVVSEELKRDGVLSVTIAVLAVLIYIWFRFEWQFGVGAVVALLHDVLLTVGFFALTRLEFNLTIIAALLTIVGYSLNDTVVVYDRVRENIRKYRKMAMEDVLNLSLNQTLSRTVMTSVTTLLALFALFFLGGEVIRGFTAAMIWGVVIGTYSSIFVASPLLMFFKIRRESMVLDEEDDPTVDKSRPSQFENF
ncbi:protein translocase subunit SecF [Kordiimonas aquimaris]|uniref:protein translocase subunit SecF n=1 Tax=Kordiimonas aquimaris TaxID=707591 RepID=UPI0021CDEC3F|nr:protein translocase subunit SecF [Kordiimonas aquimaris]